MTTTPSISHTQVFVGAGGCNVISNCLDSCRVSGLDYVIFGCSRLLAISHVAPVESRVVSTSPFNGQVTAVKFERNLCEQNQARIVVAHRAASPQKNVQLSTAVFYSIGATNGAPELQSRVTMDLAGSVAPCNALDVDADTGLVVCAGSHLHVLQLLPDCSLELVQQQRLQHPAESAAVSPSGVVALGCTDKQIHVYSRDASSGLYENTLRLRGHESWVRGLSFSRDSKYLASASQDGYSRLWEFSESASKDHTQKLSFVDHNGSTRYVWLQALLIGHSGWVQSVRWLDRGSRLLTASMDKTLMLWGVDGVDEARVGEIGGNSLGFYACAANYDATVLHAIAFNGSMHTWRLQEDGAWLTDAAPTGHVAPVEDACWEPGGRYFLSCSQDQTVRLWAPYALTGHYVELARPQIHGHDMRCVECLPGARAEHSFVSCGEEKVIRVFEGSSTFTRSLASVSGLSRLEADSLADSAERPLGASLPPLGLSNKPMVSQEELDALDVARMASAFSNEIPSVRPSVSVRPPTENLLQQSTLWPERHKVYGHGNELFSVCASPCGKYAASSCRGRLKVETDVIVWDTATWDPVCRLSGHKMTVTRVQFSPDSQLLCSTGRDKQLRVWRLQDGKYVSAHFEKVAHKRIVWDCAWSADQKLLVTASRDHTVKFWDVAPSGSLTLAHEQKRREPVTAVCFLGGYCAPYYLAVALDSGQIHVWRGDEAQRWTQVAALSPQECHAGTVKRLRCHSMPDGAQMLLSAGHDHTVRLTRFVVASVQEQFEALYQVWKLPEEILAKIRGAL